MFFFALMNRFTFFKFSFSHRFRQRFLCTIKIGEICQKIIFGKRRFQTLSFQICFHAAEGAWSALLRAMAPPAATTIPKPATTCLWLKIEYKVAYQQMFYRFSANDNNSRLLACGVSKRWHIILARWFKEGMSLWLVHTLWYVDSNAFR